MLREKVRQEIIKALDQLGWKADRVEVGYPEAQFGDYSTNVALALRKDAKLIVDHIDKFMFESVEVVKPGFINFRIKSEHLVSPSPGLSVTLPQRGRGKLKEKILLEYFQPNIAKPLHVGHMRTAIIGDCLKRMLRYRGFDVESDTHMGDWGTQFGYLILVQKKFGEVNNTLYAQLNADESMRELAKQEFVKLEKNDEDNRRIWRQLVADSVQKFLAFAQDFDLLPFEHHWPESFYEDQMSDIVRRLSAEGGSASGGKVKKLLKLSEGAQIVDLEKQGLGVAIIIKSDGGTTYLLRDLATFIFAKQQGFTRHLYVVDNRQALHYRQLEAILDLMGELRIKNKELSHINYGFVSFQGGALSTRKGNMVLASDLIKQAEEKAAKIIAEKNPALANQSEAVKSIALGALKFYDLMHNRHSDIEFDWEKVLDFEGKSGPYLQYTAARLSSILKRAEFPISNFQFSINTPISNTERRILFLLSIFDEKVEDALADYLPNIFAEYLYELCTQLNRFYHESPVLAEADSDKQSFRLGLVAWAQTTLKQGLDLLGIRALREM